jgi:Sodium:solute symporter family
MSAETSRPRPVVTASGCSAALLIGVSGALISQGYDGLAALLGFIGAIFLVSAVVAPLLTATNSNTIIGALQSQHFRPTVILLAQAVVTLCAMGLIAAELTAAGWVMARLSGMPASQASLLLAGMIALIVVVLQRRKRNLQQAGWVDGVISAVVTLSFIALLITITRPGMAPGATMVMEPALSDIARLETQLIAKRLADPALLKPHAVPFLRTGVWNFTALVVCISIGLALVWPLRSVPPTPNSRRWGRIALLATTAPILLLAPFAGEAKRALLLAFDAGIRSASLPPWLLTSQSFGAVQLCGASSIDPAAITKACGKGVGSQGFMRWHDAVIAPDALTLVGFDILATSPILMWLFGLCVLLAASVLATNLARSATLPVSLASQRWTGLSAAGLVLGGGTLAWLQPADSLTLVAWVASVALATLGPVCLATSLFGPLNSRATALAIITGATTTLILILAPRYIPLTVTDLTGAMANAPPAILRRFMSLRDNLATLPAGEAKSALVLTMERLARENITWLGLKPIASGIWGFALGTSILAITQLAAQMLSRSR